MDSRIGAEISAGPGTCADCLVPKGVMRAILGQAHASYPGEVGDDPGQPS